MVANIGFGNLVNTGRVLAIVRPDAAPVKRMVSRAKADNTVIDATQGRKTKSVIIMDEGHVILSALQPETLNKRFGSINPEKDELEEQDE
ncbi:MAG TPA: DUF370 domain-containing protein [Candidatus Alectryocaccobium stercorigallinarum]|nr:DUF370 domain-containing protein [Candidatus Alectryocaccobium stercorigallinarum]